MLGFCLTLKETRPSLLLAREATVLRKRCPSQKIQILNPDAVPDLKALVTVTLVRPVRLLFTEPIILLVSLYMSFIYGLVYALLEAYPYVFQHTYGMRLGVDGLPFIGLIIGQVIACTFIISQQGKYARKLVENKNVPVPEWRLSPTILGAPVFTIGIFW